MNSILVISKVLQIQPRQKLFLGSPQLACNHNHFTQIIHNNFEIKAMFLTFLPSAYYLNYFDLLCTMCCKCNYVGPPSEKKITCFNCVCRNSHKMLYFQTICIYLRRRKCKKKNIINKSHTFFLYFKLDLLFRKYQSRAAIHMYWYTYHLNYQWDWSICLYKIWIHIFNVHPTNDK